MFKRIITAIVGKPKPAYNAGDYLKEVAPVDIKRVQRIVDEQIKQRDPHNQYFANRNSAK